VLPETPFPYSTHLRSLSSFGDHLLRYAPVLPQLEYLACTFDRLPPEEAVEALVLKFPSL
jgi:hypothetical protein